METLSRRSGTDNDRNIIPPDGFRVADLFAVRLVNMGLVEPSRADVERQMVGLLSGALGRDAVDRWAGRYFAADVEVADPVVWQALGRLHGVDLVDGPGGEYLHDLGQVAEWLADLRGGVS
ncbi:hypothetical protein [Saccharothrix hoggarensis]|uniref:Uncharacterized protein n=1 Tax=Saccharothrix hoggarensis TaxID=913853 RepID=A0ABW3QP15_9PSEU